MRRAMDVPSSMVASQRSGIAGYDRAQCRFASDTWPGLTAEAFTRVFAGSADVFATLLRAHASSPGRRRLRSKRRRFA